MSKYKRGSIALAKQVFNTPQLIIESDLQTISQFLVNRANGIDESISRNTQTKDDPIEVLANYENEEQKQRYHKRLGITNDGKRGNLNITGTLVAKSGEIDDSCMELTSYEKLYSTFNSQVKEGITELVLYVDSGGGSAFSCFEMAKQVKDLAVKNNVKIYSFVDGMAASAAYAWASIADEVVARKDSEVGSVGVVVQLINNSKMLENVGLTRTFVYNGENKIPFDNDGGFSQKFLSNLQKKVDSKGLEFNTFVADNRNMPVESVIATQAEVFDANEAIAVGFVDKVMTYAEFYNDYLPSKNNTNLYNMNNDTPEVTMSLEELQKQLSDMTANYNTATQELSDKTKTLTDLTEAKTSLDTTVAELTKQLADETEAKQKLLDEISTMKADAITADRKARLEDVLGTENEQVASLLASTSALEATAFDAILSAMSAKVETEDKEMQEKGNNAKQDAQVPTYQERLKAVAANKSK